MKHAGLILEMRVGDSVCLKTGVLDSDQIVLILENKDGRKARLRIVASPAVKVSKLDAKTD